MTGIVLGLVEAGSRLGQPRDRRLASPPASRCSASSCGTRRRVEEPILPLRLLANATRRGQRRPRPRLRRHVRDVLLPLAVPPGRPGLLAAAGRRRLPAPSRLGVPLVPADQPVLVRGFRRKVADAVGDRLSPPSASCWPPGCRRVPPTSRSWHHWCSWVGLPASRFVSLTSASLADVDPATPARPRAWSTWRSRVGAALGLAVLVTVFGIAHPSRSARRTGECRRCRSSQQRPRPRPSRRVRGRRRVHRRRAGDRRRVHPSGANTGSSTVHEANPVDLDDDPHGRPTATTGSWPRLADGPSSSRGLAAQHPASRPGPFTRHRT